MNVARNLVVVLAVAALAGLVHGPADGRPAESGRPDLPGTAAATADPSAPPPPDGPAWREAAALRAEGSHARALEVYGRLEGEAPSEARWLEFYRADSGWRALASTAQPEDTAIEAAREALERLAAAPGDGAAPRDRVAAEALESLGDFHWMRPGGEDWGSAWPWYAAALDAWAQARDLDLAGERYLAIVARAARRRDTPSWWRGGWQPDLPPEIVENAARIARTPDDRALTRYLLALAVRRDVAAPARYDRAVAAFEEAETLAAGREWHDDVLWQAANLRLSPGRPRPVPGGGATYEPEYEAAAALLERLLAAHPEGTSPHARSARALLDEIRGPSLDVRVAEAFLPGSEIEIALAWRNVPRIDLHLYAVDVARDLAPDPLRPYDDPLAGLDLGRRDPRRSWSIEGSAPGDRAPRRLAHRLERPLEPGAYVVEARGGGRASRALLAVTRVAAVLFTGREGAVVHVADALDGTPRAGADVALWALDRDPPTPRWDVRRATTDADGFARFASAAERSGRPTIVAATWDDQPALARSHLPGTADRAATWSVHLFPDRPAYRPGEIANFKAIARLRDPHGALSTPSGRALAYRVVDARGAALSEGTLRFNEFGGAWGECPLPAAVALGDARVELTDPGDGGARVGGDILFGVEAYRLPEFRVEVLPPDDADGRPRTFRPGEVVEIALEARYYFGAPVAGATAEIVVRQSPRWAPRPARPRFAWLPPEATTPSRPNGTGAVVERASVVTDAAGRARYSFATPLASDRDWTYAVEARVVDASRREVVGAGTVEVTRQRYEVALDPEHRVVRPGDRVRVAIRALDPNGLPVEAEGRVRVTREVFDEVWVDPYGREVRGRDLERARRAGTFPPPPPDPAGPGWRLRFRGHVPETVLETTVRTLADGNAETSFRVEREGHYRIAWSGETGDLWPVEAATAVWATAGDARPLGFRAGALEIVVDRDAFRVGEEAVALIVSPTTVRHALLAVEPGGLDAVRAVRMDGDAALVRIPLEAGHAPNVWLHAAALHDAELWTDRRSVDVAAEAGAFEIEVDLGGEAHLPGAEGTATVRATAPDGSPVEAEVALAIYDQAVEAIRPDRAGDPRTFFLGRRRGLELRTTSSFAWLPYVRLVEGTGDGDVEPAPRGPVLAGGLPWEGGARGDVVASKSVAAENEPALAADAAFAREERSQVAASPAAAAGEVVVRTDFRATASWSPAVATGPDGTATVRFRWPETLTAWRAVARGAGRDARFGHGAAGARTARPLAVRLQTPRFLVAGDEAVVSALVDLDAGGGAGTARVAVELEATGVVLDAGEGPREVEVEAGGQTRVEWRVRAASPGEASFTVRAAATDASGRSDGMARAIPVVEHGVETLLARSGSFRGESATVVLDFPRARRPGSTTLEVRVSPSLAVTALDALPYLVDYPYGCTEQTLSRFLPAVLARRALVDLGLDPHEVERRMFGGIEAGHAAAVQGGRDPALGRLDDVVRDGVARLADFQHGDGSWGWWKHDDGDPYMTAYALWGLATAGAADVGVDRGSLRRAAAWLDRRLVEHDGDPDLRAWMLHALAAEAALRGDRRANDLQRAALDRAFAERERLAAYGKALLALAADRFGRAEEARTLVRNLENGVIRDDAPDRSILLEGGPPATAAPSAHWGADPIGRRWSQGTVESTAFALRALLAIDPRHPLVEPAVSWLVRNRRGAQWRHTRETAIAVMALTDALRASGERATETAYRVEVGGRVVGEARVTPATVLSAPARFEVDPALLRDGENRVRIVRTSGAGALHFAVEARLFSTAEPLAAAGHEVFVRREWLRRVPYATLLAGTREDLVPLPDLGTAASGERIEVVLTVEAKTDLEHVVLEDARPAGFETVGVESGTGVVARRLRREAAALPATARGPEAYTGETRRAHDELGDRAVATFLDRLPEGTWEIRYTLRAEAPGSYHGLPVVAHAMYVPEIRANGAEGRVTVEDAGTGR